MCSGRRISTLESRVVCWYRDVGIHIVFHGNSRAMGATGAECGCLTPSREERSKVAMLDVFQCVALYGVSKDT